jgi:hypothetical protein
MKRQQLSMGQLGLMSKALLSNLFPTPSKTELLVEKNSTASEGRLYLYFSLTYHEKLIVKMQEQNANGSYRNSNLNDRWVDLMNVVMNADDNIINIDMSNLEPHFLAE